MKFKKQAYGLQNGNKEILYVNEWIKVLYEKCFFFSNGSMRSANCRKTLEKYLFMLFIYILIQTDTNIDYDFVQPVVTTTRDPILALIIQFNASPKTSRK